MCCEAICKRSCHNRTLYWLKNRPKTNNALSKYETRLTLFLSLSLSLARSICSVFHSKWPRLVECTCSDVCTLTLRNPLVSTIAHERAHHFTYCTDWSLFDGEKKLCAILCAVHTIGKKRELSVKSTMTGKSHIKYRKKAHTDQPFRYYKHFQCNANS